MESCFFARQHSGLIAFRLLLITHLLTIRKRAHNRIDGKNLYNRKELSVADMRAT